MTRPLCLNCGKPLAKQTETVGFWHDRADAPRSLAECRQRTNLAVVSVRYWPDGRVMQFSTWDGESYSATYKHFCSGICASAFGMWAAGSGVRRRK